MVGWRSNRTRRSGVGGREASAALAAVLLFAGPPASAEGLLRLWRGTASSCFGLSTPSLYPTPMEALQAVFRLCFGDGVVRSGLNTCNSPNQVRTDTLVNARPLNSTNWAADDQMTIAITPPSFCGFPPSGTTTVFANAVAANRAACPSNAEITEGGCACPDGLEPNAAGTQCMPVEAAWQASAPLGSCADPGKKNPIFPLRGVKQETVDTGLSIGGIPFVLTYDSTAQLPRITEGPRHTSGTTGTGAPGDRTLVGEGWASNLLDQRLALASPAAAACASHPAAARAQRGDGRRVLFARASGGQLAGDAATPDRLEAVAGGYALRIVNGRTLETYSGAGLLQSIEPAGGAQVTLVYSDAGTLPAVAPAPGYAIEAQDSFGRSLRFAYKPSIGTPGRHLLATVNDAAGGTLTLGHDSADRLVSLTWPDGHQRRFLYESGTHPSALTGVVDENGSRYATFGYDAQGRATSTAHAGGADAASVAYATAPQVRVTERLDTACNVVFRSFDWAPPQGTTVTSDTGAVSAWGSTTVLGRTALTGQSQPAGSGCAASASQQGYDANGNIASRDDFNGTRVCLAHDPGRNLETVRVEGLAGGSAGTACSAVVEAGAALPAGARKVSTQWHPDWKLPTKTATAGVVTTSVYHGQPDPFNGNALASCAPADAVQRDGKPIAVLCRKVEQATDDADGAQGFAAALQAGVAPRVWQWTYNRQGQVLTSTDPRGGVSTHAYYADTTTDHRVGDLRSSTNAAGHVTQFTRYDAHGQLLEAIDPNGVVNRYTYDARRRLTSATVAGQTTLHEYAPTGLLSKTTAPDGSFVTYGHDAAHRLVSVADSLGNRIDYTLDSTGQRTAERVTDPSGVLRWQVARSIDALGRVQQVTGRE